MAAGSGHVHDHVQNDDEARTTQVTQHTKTQRRPGEVREE